MTDNRLAVAWGQCRKLWAKTDKLNAEGDKLYVEGDKLYDEAGKLWAEAAKLWTDAVLAERGDIKIEWTERGCKLETGEEFSYDR